MEIVAGNGQSAPPGAELPDPLVVKVTDELGDPVPDVRVVFELGAGAQGGELLPDTAVTRANGEASARWTLGEALGEHRVSAEVVGAGAAVVSFTATAAVVAAPQPSAERSSVGASPSTIEVGTGLSIVTVTVRDGDGEPLAGATVTLAATGLGNMLTQPSAPTGDDGRVQATFQAVTPGTREISAVVNGDVAIEETASVTVVVAPTPQRLVFLTQPSDTEEDETIAPPVSVGVVDEKGDLVTVSGIEIELELFREGRGSNELEGTTTQVTVDGVAAFPDLRVDRDEDDYLLRATAPGRPELGSVDSDTFDIED